MANGRNRIYFVLAFIISSIPSAFGFYALNAHFTFLATVLFALSFISLGLSAFLFLGYKTFKHGKPFLMSLLVHTNQCLRPLTRYLSRSIIFRPLFSAAIRIGFFAFFVVLLMSDHLIRVLLRLFVGKHVTNRYYSITSAMDPQLDLFDDSIPETRYLEDRDLFRQRKQLRMTEQQGYESRTLTTLLKRPKYSLSLAYTLAVASKLVYEDVEVIKYELRKAGFDVDRTFRPIAYKNICAFITEKDDDILLVFRGTNPLNMQNYLTNITFTMTKVESAWGPMGKVHKGFWKAMGEPRKKMERKGTDRRPILRIVLNNTSIFKTILSALKGTAKILHFLSINLFYHVNEPIDSTWIGPDKDIRTHSMYAQAEEYILKLIQQSMPSDPRPASRGSGLSSHGRTSTFKKKKRLFITGHSLGGAMGTIFLGKMLQSNSPLLEHFAGLYTYGQPKIGDAEFSRVFSPKMTSKIFHHAYNNDIIPRIPTFFDY
ncbi:hypothetical protein RMCBS344292_07491 [Rhizopus microsporus]|nr:hypothetical protein RMCBS344292_07491 [Rhizopus microsporus]